MIFKRTVWVTLLLVAFTIVPSQAGSAKSPVADQRIAIDPGHGGSELGSTACPGLLEKDANLQIALLLRDMLVKKGATVYLTREDDRELSSEERADDVNGTDAEVLVNLHLNGSDDPDLDGLYVFYGRRLKDEPLAQVMHDAMWEALGDTPTNYFDFGVRQFAAGVLLWSEIPSTLVESAFISNTDECAWLLDGERQDDIAQAVLDGLNLWFSQPPPEHPGKKAGQ